MRSAIPSWLSKGAEVELAFTVQLDAKGRGGVNLKVFGIGFEAGGEKGRSESVVHKLTVRLSPAKDFDVLGRIK